MQETIACLVGDDHEALRKGVVGVLELEPDLRVVGQAANGAETLALAERRRPDVTVVDLRMPDADGIELCRRITELGLPTAVLIYTGFDEMDALDEALAAGARGYVLKSGPPQELVRAIRAVHEGRQYLDPTLAAALLQRRSAATGSLLSPREREVLQLLADGHSTEAAGRSLFLSPATVRTYAENAMHKLEARNRVEAVAKAVRQGLLV